MNNVDILVGNDQLASVESGVVLNQRINHRAISGKIGNHVWFTDNELAVQDVVVGVVASVDNEREVHHKTGGVALTVGAGIGFVGWHSVVSQKLRVALPVNDDASAGAFHIGGDVKPAADEVQIIILICVGIYRYRCRQHWTVGVFRVLFAP